jgi:hypothetical protein
MTSPDFDGALRAALSTPMTARQRASLDGRLRVRLEPHSVRQLRIRPRGIVLILAALLVAAPAVFVVSAALRSTESPNGLASAAAFQAEIDAAKKVVPLPAGATWPSSLATSDQSGSYSAGGGRTWVEFVAFCAWDRSWLAAAASGSGAQAQVARDTILAVPTWEFYRGEFATQSARDVVDTVIAGVRSGDSGPVEQFVTTNC